MVGDVEGGVWGVGVGGVEGGVWGVVVGVVVSSLALLLALFSGPTG